MILGVFIFLAGACGITGLVKVGEAVKKSSDAKKLLKEAQHIFNKKKNELEEKRKSVSGELQKYGELKIRIWDQHFARFIKLFNKIKSIEIHDKNDEEIDLNSVVPKDQLMEIRQISLNAVEIAGGGLASMGAGALVGVASYGGAMMFASASTGTAIASLSGVAATNATLAWFGGGSLAAGGLGMAGGTLVLGGLVAGPALAVGGCRSCSCSRWLFVGFKGKSEIG